VTDWEFRACHLIRNPLLLGGLVIIAIFVILAILAPFIAPTPEGHRDAYMIPRDGYSATPQPPSEEHIFGATQRQYDIFYGSSGARTLRFGWRWC
jgi:peptide/nickel transport system permease protein